MLMVNDTDRVAILLLTIARQRRQRHGKNCNKSERKKKCIAIEDRSMAICSSHICRYGLEKTFVCSSRCRGCCCCCCCRLFDRFSFFFCLYFALLYVAISRTHSTAIEHETTVLNNIVLQGVIES